MSMKKSGVLIGIMTAGLLSKNNTQVLQKGVSVAHLINRSNPMQEIPSLP